MSGRVSPPFRLYDGQWVNVANHDECYRGYSKGEAIDTAVKLAEKYMGENVAELVAALEAIVHRAGCNSFSMGADVTEIASKALAKATGAQS